MAKKNKVGLTPAVGLVPQQQSILNQIYGSWDIHGETRREYEDRCACESAHNKEERQDGGKEPRAYSKDIQEQSVCSQCMDRRPLRDSVPTRQAA